ncbi:MAG: NADH-quinone oxidoreductase subunit NuoI [Desulfobulbaceae bacterium]|nr:NADH-quinone oxidoreductase subunit NuoI [Desulfobulbaceae bacterium]
MQIQYKKKRNLLQNLFLSELVQGMWLTLRRLFTKPITLQYPHEQPNVRRGFRGQHALVRDPETHTTRCVGCMKCVMVCPSRCIRIRIQKRPEHGNRRFISAYHIDALRCVYCGYCAEVCPVNAIILTEVFAYSAFDRKSLSYDMPQLLDNWDRYLAEQGEDLAQYVNPTWRPRGLPEGPMPAGKRLPVPDDWKGKGQVVGRLWRQSVQGQNR